MKENKNFKRLVICIVAAIMVVSAIPLMVNAENIATQSTNENGKAPLNNGNGSLSDTFYAYNAYDTSMDEGPISFPSDDPGDITLLAASGMTSFLTGGCFVEELWYASEYYDGGSYPDDRIWTIDTSDGSMTVVGDYDLTEALNGLAYDDSTDTLYGCSGTNLYTIDKIDGSATLVGDLAGISGLMVGIACDGAGTLYGIDLGDESLYSIDPSTGDSTLIGSTGLTLNYAQDMAYDKNNDILYLAAYEDPGDGSLQICDVTDGSTTLVGAFGVLEVTAFGIPYDFYTPEHDISVTDIVVPDTVAHGETQTVSAMVNNIGNNTETGIVVDFKVDSIVVDTTTIPSLLSEESTLVSFNWDPAIGTYLVEIESQPITDEYDLLNNVVNKTVDVIAAPAIDVTPASLGFMIPPDDTDSDTVTITNLPTAEASLDYTITCDDGGAGWLSALPVSGTVAINDYDDVTITADTTGMTQGDYTGSVIIDSNDLDDPQVIVPVDLTVVFEDDYSAVSINDPVGTIYDVSHVVNATIQNIGSNPQTDVTVNCSIFEGGIGGDIINEDFSSDPTDWTITHVGGIAWEWDSTNEYMENSYGTSPPNEGYLDSPVLDCSGKSGITLSFWHDWKADYSSGDQDGYVRGSTDGGSTWPYLIDEFHHNDPATEIAVKEYDISSWANNQAQVMIRYDVYNDNDWHWYVDNFTVSAEITGDLVYFSETDVSLAAYESEFVEFSPAWNADIGTYGIQVSTMLAGDENTGNDVTAETVTVEELPMPVVNIDTGEGFNTIQEAIDDADTLNGHTIEVTEGEFVGAIVNKSLTIRGSGRGDTIISSGVPYKSGSSLETAFRLDDGADGTEITDFIINCNMSSNFFFAIFSRGVDDGVIDSFEVNDAVQGISIYDGSNWEITNNVLTDTVASGGGGIGIMLGVRPPQDECSGNLVQYNTIYADGTESGYTAPGICLALDTRYGAYDLLTGSEELTNNEILDNTITGTGNTNEVGIEVGVIGVSGNSTRVAYTMGMIHDNLIQGNTVDGSDYGIYAYVVDSLSIEENEVKNCVTHGISIWDNFTGNINYNNIFGNGDYGIFNDLTTTIDATCNWWGDLSGPYHAVDNAAGAGDNASDYVDFIPWLTDSYPSGDCNGYPGPVYNIDTDEVFSTIQAAIDDVDTLNGHTLQIAAIIHAEGPQIVVSKNLTIQGYGCGITVIIPTGDTGSSGDARGWWLVNDGVEFHLKDLELDGAGFDIYQAIRHKGLGAIDNVCFTEIKYPGYGGVAIAAFGGGPVDVTNCQFTEIGRIGVLYWVTDSLFQGNTYVGKGDGDWLDYCLDIGGGGGVTVIGNTVSECTGVASSDGSESAGFMVTTYFGAGSYATIEENDISNCTMAIAVGYDEFDTSSVEAHYNNFIDCEFGIDTTAPLVNGTCNWWGDVTGPYHDVDNVGGLGCNVTDNVTFLPWLTDSYPEGDCTGGLEQLDIEQTAQDRGFPIRHALDGDWAGAQNFTPTLNHVSKVELYLRIFGTPEFDLVVELRTGGPQGALLDNVTFTPGEVPSSWTWFEVDFEDSYVGIGSDVFVVIPPAPSGVTTSFGYEWGYAFGDQYDGGSFWFTRDGGGLWRDLPTMYEFVFKTYGY